jgi:hypothetical protein
MLDSFEETHTFQTADFIIKPVKKLAASSSFTGLKTDF